MRYRYLVTGLFVCADDVIVGTQWSAQWSALPDALVKIEDGSGFASKVRIAGEDPASIFPGEKGIAAEPSPQSGATDLSNDAASSARSYWNALVATQRWAENEIRHGRRSHLFKRLLELYRRKAAVGAGSAHAISKILSVCGLTPRSYQPRQCAKSCKL
jgi:hypothetical protein